MPRRTERRISHPRDAMNASIVFHALQLNLTVSELKRQSRELLKRIERLEETAQSIQAPINTFAPKPFDILKPIAALVEPVIDEDGEPCEYIATFVDGALSATGETVEEAVRLLKGRMASQYRFLSNLTPDRLGKMPQRQLAALQSVMRRVD